MDQRLCNELTKSTVARECRWRRCRTTIRDSLKEKALRPDNHNHCPSSFCLLVGSAAFQCPMSIPRGDAVPRPPRPPPVRGRASAENHLKQGRILPRAVIAKKCTKAHQNVRTSPSRRVGGSFFSAAASGGAVEPRSGGGHRAPCRGGSPRARKHRAFFWCLHP